MSVAQFFGDLSPFQIIVSAVAFITGLYTLYKNFLERAKISVYPGDAVRIVVSPDGSASNFHLMCNLINKTTKVGTVHRLEVRISCSQDIVCDFVWNLFYKYLPGGEQVQKESDIYPVAVPQKDSRSLFVGFQAEPDQNCKWIEGRYEFKVIGWANCKDRTQSSNMESTFHIQIDEHIISHLKKPNSSGPRYITAPVEEWKRQHK